MFAIVAVDRKTHKQLGLIAVCFPSANPVAEAFEYNLTMPEDSEVYAVPLGMDYVDVGDWYSGQEFFHSDYIPY